MVGSNVATNKYDTHRELFGEAAAFRYAISDAHQIIEAASPFVEKRDDAKTPPFMLFDNASVIFHQYSPHFDDLVAELNKHEEMGLIKEVREQLTSSISVLEALTRGM